MSPPHQAQGQRQEAEAIKVEGGAAAGWQPMGHNLTPCGPMSWTALV